MGAKKDKTSARAARDARKALAAAGFGGRRDSMLWVVAAIAVAGALLVVVIVGALNHRGANTAPQGNN